MTASNKNREVKMKLEQLELLGTLMGLWLMNST